MRIAMALVVVGLTAGATRADETPVKVAVSVSPVSVMKPVHRAALVETLGTVFEGAGCEIVKRAADAAIVCEARCAFALDGHERVANAYEWLGYFYLWDRERRVLLAFLGKHDRGPWEKKEMVEFQKERIPLLQQIKITRGGEGDLNVEIPDPKTSGWLGWSRSPAAATAKRVMVDFGADRVLELNWGDDTFEQEVCGELNKAGWDIVPKDGAPVGLITVRWAGKIDSMSVYVTNGVFDPGVRPYLLKTEIQLAAVNGANVQPYAETILASSAPSFKTFEGVRKPTIESWRNSTKYHKVIPNLIERLNASGAANAKPPQWRKRVEKGNSKDAE